MRFDRKEGSNRRTTWTAVDERHGLVLLVVRDAPGHRCGYLIKGWGGSARQCFSLVREARKAWLAASSPT